MPASSIFSFFVIFLFSFLNVLQAAVWESNPTNVTASGVLTCEHYYERGWCFRIVLLEIDTFSNDVVDEYGAKCTLTKEFDYYLNGKVYGDGYRDNFYEFQLWLYHNCSEHGTIRKEVHAFEKEPVTKKEIVRVRNYTCLSDSSTIRVHSYFEDK